MGSFASVIIKGIQGIANDITSLVTDAATSVAQLTSVSQQFTPPALHKYAALDGSSNVNQAIQQAMKDAQTACTALFGKLYPNDTAAGVDSGVVSNYQDGGNVQTVITQMKSDFNDWDIITDDATINSMAKTIQGEIAAQLGKAGTAHGVHYINQNQYFDWVVAYGTFAIADGNTGLVYGFTTSYNSGW